MSEKNILQEFCQRNKLPMPIYQSWSVGPAHSPEWYASVTVDLSEKSFTKKSSAPERTSIMAEKHVARMMIKFLGIENTEKSLFLELDRKKPTDCKWIENQSSPQRIYLIDLENKPCFKNDLDSNSLYIGFIGSTHPTLHRYSHWHQCQTDNLWQEIVQSGNNLLIYLVDGGTADLVDHFVTLFCYPLVEYLQKIPNLPTIYIVSTDHAGWCTRIALERVVKWRNMTIETKNCASI